LAGFSKGLQEIGIVEGRNAAIETRWARGEYGRLPGLAADLVAQGAAVIVTQTLPAALAAKAATTKIPIVFVIGEDPVEVGLVQTLNRPGSNVTGLSNFMNLLAAKRLEVLSETVPSANALALLVNPNNPNADPDTQTLQAAAQALGRRIEVLRAASEAELGTAFAAIATVARRAFRQHRFLLCRPCRSNSCVSGAPPRSGILSVTPLRHGGRLDEL
jgi:putative ABC transport system substrate-binding protein